MSHPTWWPQAAARLLGAKPALLALDFDGTLAPLVDNPDNARMLPTAQAALSVLAQVPTIHLALVSGRPAHDLVKLAQPPSQTLIAGSHGAELGQVVGGRLELQPQPLSEEQRGRLDGFDQGLTALVQAHGSPPGAWVEHKPVAHVLHTRLVDNAAVASTLTDAAVTFGQGAGAHVLNGKDVVELAVVPAGKAGALQYLREQVGAAVVGFAGDDVTDELALRTLEPPDVAIRLGQGPTAAEFKVDGPEQICAFLAYLTEQLMS